MKYFIISHLQFKNENEISNVLKNVMFLRFMHLVFKQIWFDLIKS